MKKGALVLVAALILIAGFLVVKSQGNNTKDKQTSPPYTNTGTYDSTGGTPAGTTDTQLNTELQEIEQLMDEAGTEGASDLEL
ncbi:MAG: hypothetical protein Q7S76_00190 [bacterium]|nr:hypothetical protein [bacterium]